MPVISKVTVQPHAGPDDIRTRMVEQMTASVRWEASISRLLAQVSTRFIEVGSSTALAGLLKQINKEAQTLKIADVASLEATGNTLTS